MIGSPARMRAVATFGLLSLGLSLALPSTSRADGRSAPKSKTVASGKTRANDSSAPVSTGRCVHVVSSGETLNAIAHRYRIGRSSLASANRLSQSSVLRVGQRLRVAGCQRATEPRAIVAIAPDGTSLTAKVGPLRIPTRLFVAMPDVTSADIDFQWPVDGSVASNFGRRRGGWHAGIDIWAELGAPIRAAAAGEVIVSGWEPSYGFRIKIRHADGFTSLYAHNLENAVAVGEAVEQGAIIGSVGQSGLATSPHLHFEIRRDDMAYNPLHFLEAGHATALAAAVGVPLDGDPDRD